MEGREGRTFPIRWMLGERKCASFRILKIRGQKGEKMKERWRGVGEESRCGTGGKTVNDRGKVNETQVNTLMNKGKLHLLGKDKTVLSFVFFHFIHSETQSTQVNIQLHISAIFFRFCCVVSLKNSSFTHWTKTRHCFTSFSFNLFIQQTQSTQANIQFDVSAFFPFFFVASLKIQASFTGQRQDTVSLHFPSFYSFRKQKVIKLIFSSI